jgi:hypothetical protein
MRLTLRDRVAALFQGHPDVWIDWREIAQVGGGAAWRTRVSDCRLQLAMLIENETVHHEDWTESRYRFRPDRLF